MKKWKRRLLYGKLMPLVLYAWGIFSLVMLLIYPILPIFFDLYGGAYLIITAALLCFGLGKAIGDYDDYQNGEGKG